MHTYAHTQGTGALRGSAASLQKQLDDQTKAFDTERAQIREKANALLKDKDAFLAKVRSELQASILRSPLHSDFSIVIILGILGHWLLRMWSCRIRMSS